MIAYADSVTEPDVAPLRTLRSTLADLTGDAFTTVHLLPFFPATSDGGFAVVDHKAVAARLGAWADVEAIAGDFTLMADLVCNHVSSRHAWVLDLLAGRRSAGADCLMTASPDDDLSAVVRPRTNPLLRAVDTPAGERHLWCTFSHDQVDVDYRRPEALLELLSVVDTLLGHGVRWLRLDAVAYVWKEPGTACVHLPQCHELVKLLRDLVSVRDRRAVVITETNVPHDQNASYFGDGDEAHVVYNFALPPLLVHSFVSGSAAALQRWAAGLGAAPAGTTYLNFLAGHDGIGLRPVEELLSAAETDRLVAAAHAAGGGHSDYDA
ncbi:MAG TPA: alpha-amylase, partial [Acidimicrobiaceae bacterium]|nr:alpha-amylase [Acidimicrobiaceae bacterium]